MIDKIVLSVAYERIQRPYYLILTGLLETLRQLCPNMLNVALLIERPSRLIKTPPLIPGNKSSRVPVGLTVLITFICLPLLARCFNLYVLFIQPCLLPGCQFLYDFLCFPLTASLPVKSGTKRRDNRHEIL